MSAEPPPSREIILRTRMLNWFAASAKISWNRTKVTADSHRQLLLFLPDRRAASSLVSWTGADEGPRHPDESDPFSG